MRFDLQFETWSSNSADRQRESKNMSLRNSSYSICHTISTVLMNVNRQTVPVRQSSIPSEHFLASTSRTRFECRTVQLDNFSCGHYPESRVATDIGLVCRVALAGIIRS